LSCRFLRNKLVKLPSILLMMSISALFIFSTSHAQPQSQNSTAPTGPAATPMHNAPAPVAFDEFVKFHAIMQQENKEFKEFIFKQTDKFNEFIFKQTGEFKEFIYTVVGSAVTIILGTLAFFGWKTASGMRGKYDLMLQEHLDKAEKQVELSFKAVADKQIAAKVAELNQRIDEKVAELNLQIDHTFDMLQNKFEKRREYNDKWFTILSSPPEEPFKFIKWMSGKRALWVDDNPDNNKDMVGLLTKTGDGSVEFSRSTGDAIHQIEHRPEYDVIISDMKRDSDAEAGLKFLDELKQRKITVPTIIFTSTSSLRSLGQKCIDEGAYAVVATNLGFLRALTGAVRGEPHTGVEGAA
jgi:CheY-like chemotaxis protein